MQKDFQKDQMVLTEKQKQEKQKEFQDKVDSYRKMQGEAQALVSKKQAELMGKSVEAIKAIVADIAKKQGLQIVIDAPDQSVLYAQAGVDLTNEVIKLYDAKGGK
jgi:outer membrane protein